MKTKKQDAKPNKIYCEMWDKIMRLESLTVKDRYEAYKHMRHWRRYSKPEVGQYVLPSGKYLKLRYSVEAADKEEIEVIQ